MEEHGTPRAGTADLREPGNSCFLVPCRRAVQHQPPLSGKYGVLPCTPYSRQTHSPFLMVSFNKIGQSSPSESSLPAAAAAEAVQGVRLTYILLTTEALVAERDELKLIQPCDEILDSGAGRRLLRLARAHICGLIWGTLDQSSTPYNTNVS